MDLLDDIVEVERRLVQQDAVSSECLALQRSLACARQHEATHAARDSPLATLVDQGQESAWKAAHGAWREQAEVQVQAWLEGHRGTLQADAAYTLTHIIPQLYDKLLEDRGAECSAKDTGPSSELAQQLQLQVDELRLALASATDRGDGPAHEDVLHHTVAKLETVEAENRRLMAANGTLQQQLGKHIQQRAAAEKDQEQLEALRENDKVNESKLLELEAECTELCRQVDALQAKNGELVAENASLASELQTLRCEHAAELEDRHLKSRSAPSCDDIPADSYAHLPADAEPVPAAAVAAGRAQVMGSPASSDSSDTRPSAGTPIQLEQLLASSPARCARSHDRTASAAAAGAQHPSPQLVPASPAKRHAHRSMSPRASFNTSPLKRRAHSFGIGERVAGIVADPPIAVPLALWDTASAHQGGCMPRGDAAVADVPLSQQPWGSDAAVSAPLAVADAASAVTRASLETGAAPNTGHTHQRAALLVEAGVQCALLQDTSTDGTLLPLAPLRKVE